MDTKALFADHVLVDKNVNLISMMNMWLQLLYNLCVDREHSIIEMGDDNNQPYWLNLSDRLVTIDKTKIPNRAKPLPGFIIDFS